MQRGKNNVVNPSQQLQLIIIEHSLWTDSKPNTLHRSSHFILTLTYEVAVIITSLLWLGNWNSERLSKLFKVTQQWSQDLNSHQTTPSLGFKSPTVCGLYIGEKQTELSEHVLA